MSNFRWTNIPIPQGHIIFLVAGAALHVCWPFKLFEVPWLNHVIGWPLLLLGSLLAVWAVVSIKTMDISQPTHIIDCGPYAFSRNPMYVAWTVFYVGIAMVVNTWWLVVLLPAVTVFTHYFVVRREEHKLEQQFGKPYRQYCDHVRRYL